MGHMSPIIQDICPGMGIPEMIRYISVGSKLGLLEDDYHVN
jgi:hypothetical protein